MIRAVESMAGDMPRTIVEYKKDLREKREEILRIFLKHYPGTDTSRIVKAMDYADLLHRGQLRRNGLPYFFHPLAVTRLVADAQLDESSVISALLHDTIEDTVASKQAIADKFGTHIAEIVHALTKIRTYSAERREEDKQLTYKRILKASSKDIRPLLIKIFDRLNNMRDMMHMPEGHRRRVAAETLDIYVPFIRRLGMRRIERELSNLALYYLYPERFRQTEKRIEKEAQSLETELYETVDVIKNQCLKYGIDAETVIVWPMVCDFTDNEVGINPKADLVIRISIIIEDLIQIYTALGVLHSLFTPVPLHVKDRIGNPMANGYRALETRTIIRGQTYEFSILSQEMYKVNDHGIIHNWKDNQNRLSRYYTSYMKLLDELVTDEEMRIDDVLQQSTVDGIAVFSPRKDLYVLPHQATVLDFAYMVHRQVGDRAKKALVNGIEREISHVLKPGDVIQIITEEDVRPEERWLTFVVTTKARSAINGSLRKQLDLRATELGMEMLYTELEKYGRDPKVVVESKDFTRILDSMGLSAEELYRNMGFRQILPADFINQHGIVAKSLIRKRKKAESNSIRDKIFSTMRNRPEFKYKFAKDDVFIKYAQCCHPIFGDRVVGVVTAGKGVTVHRSSCPNLKRVSVSDQVQVEWDMEKKLDSAVLNLHLTDQKNVLAKALNVVSKYGINMSEFNAYTVGHEAFMKFRLDVKSQQQLLRVVHDIRKIEAVLSISREE